MNKVINKAFRYRLYPNIVQERVLASFFGQVRFVYNYFLRKRIDYYIANKTQKKKGLNYHDTAKMLTLLKKQNDFSWLQESNSQALQQSLRNLDTAYFNFFKQGCRFPNFKKKHNKQSFCVPQHFYIDTKKKLLHIPKLAPIKIVLHRQFEGIVKSVTISKTCSDRYFASVLCEITKKIAKKKTGKEIGIDLGLKSFIVTSNKERIDPPKFLHKSEKKLCRLQQLLSRKKKGSKNRNKARIKIARIHEHISNQRKDFLHKLSSRLVSENQAIFAEDLHVKGILTNHHLAKSVSDASWSEFIRQIKYKSEWNNVVFTQVDRFFPSSKRCNSCGWINESLTLADRDWTCQSCKKLVDRDFNSAQNILQFGKLSLNTVGGESAKHIRPGRLRVVKRVAELGSPPRLRGG